MPKQSKEKLIEEKKSSQPQNKKSSNSTTKKGTTKVSTKTTKPQVKTITQKTNSKIKNTTTSKTKKATTSKKKLPIVEYYDLPNLYNQTIVKILAQTPTVLFVYWDISTEDKNIYFEKYGDDFFNNTIPYLLITNQTKNYSFEVEINDYANSWYVNINDSDCKYDVVLFRKPKNLNSNNLNNSTIYIASSNSLQTPNDRILFDSISKTVFFKNVKNNEIIAKDTTTLSFINNVGRIYNIYDLYKEIYKNEFTENKLDTHLNSSKMSI